jgi:hypothetical protein
MIHRQLRLAVHTLITEPGSIQRRLAAAWRRHLIFLQLEDAPAFLQEAFAKIKAEFSIAEAAPEDIVDSGLTMPDEQARELAKSILLVSDDIAEMAIPIYYRQIFTVLRSCKAQEKKSGDGIMEPTKHEFMISTVDPQQKLLLAVHILAADVDSLQSRLSRVWKEHIIDIKPGELPEHLRQPFVDIRNKCDALLSGTAADGAILISEDKAMELASNILILADAVTEVFTINYYKDIVTGNSHLADLTPAGWPKRQI